MVGVGVKDLTNNIEHNRKLSKYRKVSKDFLKNRHTSLQNHYLIKWDNIRLWEKQFEYITNVSSSKEKYSKEFPTAISFRDYCYKQIQTVWKEATAHHDPLTDCVRDKSWST